MQTFEEDVPARVPVNSLRAELSVTSPAVTIQAIAFKIFEMERMAIALVIR
jgi:hypothetical protein